jgi:hypothetical protein
VDLTQCYIDSTTTEPFGLVIDTGFSALNILKIDLGRAFEHTVQVHPLGQFHSSNYYALSMFGALPSNLEHLRFSLDRLRYSYNPVDFTYIFQESEHCFESEDISSFLQVLSLCKGAPCGCNNKSKNEEECPNLLSLPVKENAECPKLYEADVQWPVMPECSRFEQDCSEYSPLLKGTVQRHCGSESKMDSVDFSRCYFHPSTTFPCGLVWVGFLDQIGFKLALPQILQEIKDCFPKSILRDDVELAASHFYDGIYRVTLNITFSTDDNVSQIVEVFKEQLSNKTTLGGLQIHPGYSGIRVFRPTGNK